MTPNGRSEFGTWTEQRINDIMDNVALGDAPMTTIHTTLVLSAVKHLRELLPALAGHAAKSHDSALLAIIDEYRLDLYEVLMAAEKGAG